MKKCKLLFDNYERCPKFQSTNESCQNFIQKPENKSPAFFIKIENQQFYLTAIVSISISTPSGSFTTPYAALDGGFSG